MEGCKADLACQEDVRLRTLLKQSEELAQKLVDKAEILVDAINKQPICTPKHDDPQCLDAATYSMRENLIAANKNLDILINEIIGEEENLKIR